MMRGFRLLVGALLFLPAAPAMAQTGFDRRGGDYTNFQIRNADPEVCSARCDRDSRCRAWSFVYPANERTVGVCWLKSQVPPRTEDKCCVSGVRGAGVIEPRLGAMEFSIDRTGGDYRNFDIKTNPAPEACKTECENDNRCRAWTFARPGYTGPSARCFLKSEIKRPRAKPCCISGVVR